MVNTKLTRSGAETTLKGSRRLSLQPHPVQRQPEIRRFEVSKLVPIALSPEVRNESARLLNPLLADTMFLYAMYKKHHWLVAGPTFYQLHLLFDKHAGEQLELIDLLAERVQCLGGLAVGDPRHAAELTRIPRPPDGAEEPAVMIGRLLEAHEAIIVGVREAIQTTNESMDWGTNDLLIGAVLRRHEFQVWFLSGHAEDQLDGAWAHQNPNIPTEEKRNDVMATSVTFPNGQVHAPGEATCTRRLAC